MVGSLKTPSCLKHIWKPFWIDSTVKYLISRINSVIFPIFYSKMTLVVLVKIWHTQKFYSSKIKDFYVKHDSWVFSYNCIKKWTVYLPPIRSWSFESIADEICVETGALLYDFSLFQTWIFAILDNNIKNLGLFAGSVKTAVKTIL